MDIKKQVISGVKWTTVNTVFAVFAQIIKTSFLARLLEKSDFGLMALVMLVLGYTNLFVDMGLSSALISRKNISRVEISSLFWLNLLFSCFLFFLAWLISPFVSKFYHEPELIVLIPIMSFSIIFSAIGRPFKVLEQKELNFKFITIVEIVSTFISIILAIVLAYLNYGVYALVYSALFLQVCSNLVYFFNGCFKQGLFFHFRVKETIPFLKIGIYQVGGQVINYFNGSLDILLVGKFFSPEILGGYSLAKQLVFRPAQVINPILTKVGAPALAKFQSSLDKLKTNYLKILKTISSLNLIVYLLIILLAKPLVRILYGNDFTEITVLVQVLSIFMYFRSLNNPVGSLVIATGRTDLEFYWNVVTFFIWPIVIYFSSKFSILFLTFSLTFTMIILTILAWYFMIRKMITISLGDYLNNFIPKRKDFKELIHNRNIFVNK